MSDSIDDLYVEIEKAKGLLPRGGSARAFKRIARLAETGNYKYRAGRGDDGNAAGKRPRAALAYLAGRRKGAWNRPGHYDGTRHRVPYNLPRTGKYKPVG